MQGRHVLMGLMKFMCKKKIRAIAGDLSVHVEKSCLNALFCLIVDVIILKQQYRKYKKYINSWFPQKLSLKFVLKNVSVHHSKLFILQNIIT